MSDYEDFVPEKPRKYTIDDFHPNETKPVNCLNQVNSIFLGEEKTYKRSECIFCMKDWPLHLIDSRRREYPRINNKAMKEIFDMMTDGYLNNDPESACLQIVVYYMKYIQGPLNKNLSEKHEPLPQISMKLVYDHFKIHTPLPIIQICQLKRKIGQDLDIMEREATMFKKLQDNSIVYDHRIGKQYILSAKMFLEYDKYIEERKKK